MNELHINEEGKAKGMMRQRKEGKEMRAQAEKRGGGGGEGGRGGEGASTEVAVEDRKQNSKGGGGGEGKSDGENDAEIIGAILERIAF